MLANVGSTVGDLAPLIAKLFGGDQEMARQFAVDRARFLTFAAAFAGATSFQACSATDTAPNENAGSGGLAEAGQSSTSGDAGLGGEHSTAGTGGNAGEAGLGGASGAGGDSAGPEGGASDGGAAGASACSDSVGVASCTGVTTACAHYCNAALTNLKPGVADAAIACLKLDASSNCDHGYGCLAQATAQGCPVDVATACSTAVTECNEPEANEPSCEQLLSGMNAAARAEAASCIQEGCYSVYSCAEGLFFE